MKTFVVGFFNMFNNELKLKKVEVETTGAWKDAVKTAFPELDFSNVYDEDLEAWKVEAFNGDCMIDVLEI